MTSQSLQIQANLDALQAQVNPHFLYNLLNVISSMGLESGNEDICDICDRIASMLRYSTSTVEREASVRQEFAHARNYLSLLKERYEHKLTYECRYDKKIAEMKIPKMVLQPLIENAINHNFKEGVQKIQIDVSGQADRTGNEWLLTIGDNGKGISQEEIAAIRTRLEKIIDALESSEAGVEMSLGGLGLTNTYVRLFLFFGENFQMNIESPPEGGTRITIHGKMPAKGFSC